MSSVHPKDPEASPCGVDDMTKLAYLHEPGVLQNLKSRYDMNEIYVSRIILTSTLNILCFYGRKVHFVSATIIIQAEYFPN
jgi:hypothetical protein